MSLHAPDTSTAQAEVVFADDADPFTPKPLISDLLRTRYCIPDSVFLVESIETLPVAQSKRWKAVRLLLGDGQLCIQALLRREMHRFLDIGAVRVGCYVRLGECSVHFQNVVAEDNGVARTRQMIYLIVGDMVTVGWHRALTEPDSIPQRRQAHVQEDEFISDSDLDIDDLKRLELPTKTPEPVKHLDLKPPSTPGLRTARGAGLEETNHLDKQEQERDYEDDEDAEEEFEVMQVSETKATQLRAQANDLGPPVALPRDWTDPTIPLKLTALKSIPNLPYKQNWSVNVLAVVISLSDVEPSHMPPHTQRTARLVDPSTSKQVILTVFLDAEEFCPKIGSVVLLVGVKNHRFDGGCLKKYVSDRPKSGNRWWFEEPRQFEWCDVDGLKAWWEQKQMQGLGLENT
ncbi:cyclin-like F-box [Colletotrichum truncatum]|uniref:Cyclin-like F-box n=1 Tax=Colletotrichum truncatum TaxID=5467 RepID=A0ACC3ZBZ9_COLTU|nr:cyclin-like F-box [Colletotrichum truncatum]KAF6783782.1 cyclin-like F-box [Colletotrichum truncatum]